MRAATVYLEVDGAPVDAEKCCWIVTAPCGCLEGVTTAKAGEDLYSTEEQARLHMAGNRVRYQRELEEGLTYRLVTFESFRAMPFSDCNHTPKWGIERAEPPSGFQWGTADRSFGRQTHIKHMVPVGCIPVPGEKYPEVDQKALCGKAARGWWHEVEMWVDCVSCKKCDAAAAATPPVGAS